MKKTTKYHHGNLRKELIKVGIELLDEGGIEAVGIRQVARKAGVAHSSPANHFKNKRALFTALATEIFQDLLAAIQTMCRTDNESLRDSVHQFSKIILEFGLQHPNRYKLTCRTDCIDREDSALYDAMESVYQHLTTILQEYAKQKNIDVESQAIALWSLVHGYVSLRLEGILESGQDTITGTDRQAAIIDVIIEGLLQ